MTAVARPFVPAALEIVAVAVVPEDQVTLLVKFIVEESEKVPVAVNCLVRPSGIDGLVGVTLMDSKTAAVTVRVVLSVMPLPASAVMVVVPGSTAVANPSVPVALEIVAVAFVFEDQVTLSVRSMVEESENVPVAVNC